MAIGTYISIITLNVNGSSAPSKIHRMDTKTRPIYMLSTRNPLQNYRHIQTESERMKKYIPCKWEAKESWSSNQPSYQTKQTLKKITRDKDTTQ